MKKYINDFFSQKKKAVFSALLLVCLLAVSSLFFLSRDARAFQNFSKDFFISELTSNTLNMHYTIANPSSYGIKDYTPILPAYSKAQKANSYKELINSLQLLKSLDSSKLNEKEAYTYNLLLSYLETEKAGLSLYYYDNPLSPSSGMQSQLPILLAEYTLRNKQDIQDYLALLDQTDTYFDGIITFLKEQAAQGLFMPDYSVDKVITQCETIMDKSSLNDGTHFLDTSFSERLDALVQNGIISSEEKAAYMSDNDRLLTTIMLPAYKKLGDELLLLKGSGKNENGLYYYPKGREYYLYLLRSHTGSNRDIKDIKMLLFKDFERNLQKLYSLVQSDPTVFSSSHKDEAFIFSTPEEMLKNLQKMMAKEYPSFSEVATDTQLPACTVKNIAKNLEKYCSPAFYLTPPLDDIRSNVIYINQKNNPHGLELYTTLAHEGYPGHLYQTVYSQLYFGKNKINPVRSLLSYGGYVEGWAMYVELDSYDYAKTLMQESSPETAILYESYKLDRMVQLCLYSLLDIAIHYEGADYSQIHKMLCLIGISNPSTTKAIYEYIAEEPATYTKYYLGYLEILELKKEAIKTWGNEYDEYRFHQFYLENGPSDFENLRKQLKKNRAISD